ncbi:hypothetical protein D0865_09102 [Hortaea werneckii]|uniref:DUF7732 domain-containing protein n=1 Tax=Hortaea werneckii TaxID=91943 RepID=A0A3M7C4I2_HORWE|nr:hypothetical protein D0865_09102 [Hortaea werneckii]
MKISQSVFWLLAFVTTIHALALPASFDDFASSARELYKRKGGGGGGGRGGGGGVSSGGRGSSSSSGSRGSSGGGGGRVAGSGIRPTYGGGRYYGGGAVTPYKSGRTTPGGIAPYVLAGGALAFFPGVWLYGAYAYAYPHYYTYRNETTGNNETHPSVSRVVEQNGTDTLFINGTLPNGTEETATSAAPAFKQNLAEMSGLWVVVAGVVYTMWFM